MTHTYENPKIDKLRRKWDKEDKQELDAAIAGLLQTKNGRLLFWWLFGLTRAIGQNPFAGAADVTAFNCGEQNIGQQLMAKTLQISPGAFIQMMKENQDVQNAREVQIEQLADGE